MSAENAVPKCPNQNCDSINFKIELNTYIQNTDGNGINVVFCSKCGTIIGVLPSTPS